MMLFFILVIYHRFLILRITNKKNGGNNIKYSGNKMLFLYLKKIKYINLKISNKETTKDTILINYLPPFDFFIIPIIIILEIIL